MFKICGVSMSMLLLVGCAGVPTYQTYKGVALPPEKVATISTESEHDHTVFIGMDNRMYIIGVDGRRPPTKSTTDVPWPESATVLPGYHRIKVQWDGYASYAWATVTATFEAGKTYRIRQEPQKKSVRVWMEEVGGGGEVGVVHADEGP